MRSAHVSVLALLLISIGLSLCWFKVSQLGLPLLPTENADVWTVEARIEFRAKRDTPVKIQFHIPRQPFGYTVVNESFVSGNYGLTTEDDGIHRMVQWAVREIKGYQVLYYRIHLSRDGSATNQEAPPPPNPENQSDGEQLPEALQSASEALMEEVRNKSADTSTFVRELLTRLNAPAADPNVILLRQGIDRPEDWVRRVKDLLQVAKIPSRVDYLLLLRDGMSHGELTPWLSIYDGQRWIALDPHSGDQGTPIDSIVWHSGGLPVLDAMGAKNPKVEFSVTERAQDRSLVAEQRAKQMGSRLMEFSLYSLPVGTQNVYRVLLMVPIGAFLIVFLRNVVGLKAFGTFMPILIALAFRETELVWGMVLFCVLIALGLLIRFYLEYLKLLLVPRLASVLIIVIMLMAMISLISHKLGFDRGLSVALFPMVIMAMTIERMSLVWEELGPSEALMQGFGSLGIAALSYLCMSSVYLEHLVFVFPELLLVILALTLLLGRYTGYRLTELWRFRAALRE